jgi:hypothetical protein
MAQAVVVGSSNYVFVSDLTAQGYTPFGTGGVAGDLFGMSNGTDIYLCFLLDTPVDQSARQSALIAELQGGTTGRAVPNIPVVCVITQ